MSKEIFLFLVVFMGLVGCTTSQHVNIVNTYSTSPIFYQKVGYKDEWKELWPIVRLKNEVLVKVHPDSWESLTFGTKNCSTNQSKFFIQFWSNTDTVVDFENSYFLTEQEDKVAIKSVHSTLRKDKLFSENKQSSLIQLRKVKLSKNEILNLWKSNNYRELKDNSGGVSLVIETESFVGCPRDSYRFYISFKYEGSDAQQGYWLYFAPVEFKAFSR
ncbi:hypothetical protein [Shewanella fidelis]|uniref:hypothetical protein n=1 Tax=Shewanella fidelis TaxID=173509 RepID=UPI000490E333|nr:hypothetical protein [Shewanella fidelis]